MRQRRRSLRSARIAADSFTMMDELMASAIDPAPTGTHDARINSARDAVEQLRSPETANPLAWSICAMVGNSFETMLKQGVVADPDGLLADAFGALRRAAERVNRGGKAIHFEPDEYAAIAGMVEDWAEVITHAPARAVIRAFRVTDFRVRAIEAGQVQPGDYVVTTLRARHA